MDTREKILKLLFEGRSEMKGSDLIADNILSLITPQWISVDERLPEEEGLYLIQFENLERRPGGLITHGDKDMASLPHIGIVGWLGPLPSPLETKEAIDE
jgi:hypothetical protein